MRDGGSEATHLSQWAGLGKRNPVVAGIFAFLLLAFAGIPLTSGFTAKFAVFAAAVAHGGAGPGGRRRARSAIAAFVYVRVIVLMYFSEPAGDDHARRDALGGHHARDRPSAPSSPWCSASCPSPLLDLASSVVAVPAMTVARPPPTLRPADGVAPS